MSYEVETLRRVYDNDIGKHIEVRPDGDGLGLLEIDGKDEYGRLVLSAEHAIVLAKAIHDCATEMLAAID